MIARLLWYLDPISLHHLKIKYKNSLSKLDPHLLTKLSGSAHVNSMPIFIRLGMLIKSVLIVINLTPGKSILSFMSLVRFSLAKQYHINYILFLNLLLSTSYVM